MSSAKLEPTGEKLEEPAAPRVNIKLNTGPKKKGDDQGKLCKIPPRPYIDKMQANSLQLRLPVQRWLAMHLRVARPQISLSGKRVRLWNLSSCTFDISAYSF
jgi:hypothetical protein